MSKIGFPQQLQTIINLRNLKVRTPSNILYYIILPLLYNLGIRNNNF